MVPNYNTTVKKSKKWKLNFDRLDPTLCERATLSSSMENMSLDSDSSVVKLETNPIGTQSLTKTPDPEL